MSLSNPYLPPTTERAATDENECQSASSISSLSSEFQRLLLEILFSLLSFSCTSACSLLVNERPNERTAFFRHFGNAKRRLCDDKEQQKQ